MNNSEKSSPPQAGRAIVLSVKPKYAELILSRSKTVEFRRVWAAQSVDTIAIYASAPLQEILGLVQVSSVVRATPATLWSYCSKRGGGLSKAEFSAYMTGKDIGFAVLLHDARRFNKGIDPYEVIEGFSPPQSFRYVTALEMQKLEKTPLRQQVV